MTYSNPGQSGVRSIRPVAATHLFAIGQAVRMRGIVANTADVYRITATLPPNGNSLQYRIRNEEERHERVTTQDNLEPIPLVQTGATLIERTFGHGQGNDEDRDQVLPDQLRTMPTPLSPVKW